MALNKCISEEQLDLFLQGKTSATETLEILEAMVFDPSLQEYVISAQRMNHTIELKRSYGNFIPITQLAADDGDNLCDIQCEHFLLNKYGREVSENSLTDVARKNYWLNDLGTPFYNVGKLLEDSNLLVIKKYNANIETLKECISGQDGELIHDAIVVVNNNILVDGEPEDYFADENPNHAVVVLNIDQENNLVDIYNPSTGNNKDTYNLDLFIRSWNESKNYLVLVREKQFEHEYSPTPIDVDNVTLSPDLEELIETIAENAHEVWAAERKAQGWSYGEQRDDEKKHNPCMVPYSHLPESEKKFDRDMATNTIKLLKRIGYRIVNVNELHRCPNCGEAIEMHNLYCSHCGRKLEWEDFK